LGGSQRRILVVDDSRASLEHVASLLAGQGYDVETATDGVSALKRLRTETFDLAVVDVLMPGLDGLELLRHLKHRGEEEFLPVILLSVRADVESRVQGLRLGADDYLGRPFRDEELLARAEALLRIKAIQERVRAAKKELEKLSVTDGLTGLFNHRFIQSRLKEEFRRAQRYGDPLHVLLLDLDHFKDVNDRHGHLVGDTVLREFSEVLTTAVRETDLVARYGGEEFVVLLPHTREPGALAVAERIRLQVDERGFARERNLAITVSGGLVGFPDPTISTPEMLLRHADEALYQAKREGRNRIGVRPAPSAAATLAG
jgi:two-component system cell cycle response regulator